MFIYWSGILELWINWIKQQNNNNNNNIFIKQKEITLDKVWLICTYSTGQKFGPITIFNVFERNFSYAYQACIYLIKNIYKKSPPVIFSKDVLNG